MVLPLRFVSNVPYLKHHRWMVKQRGDCADSKTEIVKGTTIAEIIWLNQSLDIPSWTLWLWVGKPRFSSGRLSKFSLDSGQNQNIRSTLQRKWWSCGSLCFKWNKHRVLTISFFKCEYCNVFIYEDLHM